MRKKQGVKHSALIYDDQGAVQVSEQIMNAYKSGCINKEGFHGDLGSAVHYK